MARGDYSASPNPPRDDNESNDTAQAYLDSLVEEHRRITRMARFLIMSDDLDKIVANAVKNIIADPPTFDPGGLEMTDVADISANFPYVDSLLNKELFQGAAFPFRLLRRSLVLHQLNPIEEGSVSEITLPEEMSEDPWITEKVWFLLFIGASTEEVSNVLHEYREMSNTSRQWFRAWTKERTRVSAIAQFPKFPTRSHMLNTHAAERIQIPTSYGISQVKCPRISHERNHGNNQDVRAKIEQEGSTHS